MTTSQSNQLIAEFMELERTDSHSELYVVKIDGNLMGCYHIGTMLYDKKWGWIMPVVEKILEQDHDGGVFFNEMTSALAELTGIQGVYDAVVRYIQTQNEVDQSLEKE